MAKTAIVLFNLGGPDSPVAVQPFLFNLFNDPAIISLPNPFRWLLAKLISSRRAPVAQEIYEHLGGKSPLLENTEAQARALETALAGDDSLGEVRCWPVMRYWHPFADQVAGEVKAWGADQVLMLPLYPQFSTTTSGSSFEDWDRMAAKAGLAVPTKRLCCYPAESGFVSAAAAKIDALLQEKGLTDGFRLLFSAHGLPQKVVDGGDPYQKQVEMTAAAVVDKLDRPGLDWKVCYQSRVGRLEWIKPYTEDELKRAGDEKKPVVIVPIAFVSEHSETLVELDIEYGELAEEVGIPAYHRVGTVDCHPDFINGLATLARQMEDGTAALSCDGGKRICPAPCGRCPNRG